jgi:hypothetical protein
LTHTEVREAAADFLTASRVSCSIPAIKHPFEFSQSFHNLRRISMSDEHVQQEMHFSGSRLVRQKSLREHILAGDDTFASIVNSPSLAAVKCKAVSGDAARFTIAGAMAVILEPDIREFLRQGMPITRETCPQLFKDAFEIDVSLDRALVSSRDEIDKGFLQRGIARFPVLKLENYPLFGFRFSVIFCARYDPDAPGIKGSLHIPQHRPWVHYHSVCLKPEQI